MFALFASMPVVAISSFLVIGLVCVSMNPAMVTRVMRAAAPDPLVDTMHASMINAGLALGTRGGGTAIDAGLGVTERLLIGFGLALLGVISFAPSRLRQLPA